MIALIQIAGQTTQNEPLPTMMVVLVIVGTLICLVFLFIIIAFFKTWIRAYAAGVPVSFGELIGMRLRKVPAGRIVEGLILLHKAGVGDVTLDALEHHYLAGGNVTPVVRALVAAKRVNMDLTFEHAAAIDLAGRDVVAEVRQAAEGAPVPGA